MSTGHPESAAPWLVADIGGTHARFGLVGDPALDVTDVATLRCADYDGPAQAVGAYLDGVAKRSGAPIKPHRIAFAVASACDGDRVAFTNNDWSFSRVQTAAALEVASLEVINDFEALALAAPHLRPDELAVFGDAAPSDAPLVKVVIGPGTGLGVATAVPTPSGWIAVPGEGGHATLSAADAFEADVLRAAHAEFDHVSAERLLSGIGLPVLLRAIARVRGGPVPTFTAEDITRRAVDENDTLCALTLDTFASMLGGFAGNVALTLGARGGVYLGGGIVPRLGPAFAQARFRARFEAKGRFTGYLAAIATAVITAPYPALAGAARALASRPAP